METRSEYSGQERKVNGEPRKRRGLFDGAFTDGVPAVPPTRTPPPDADEGKPQVVDVDPQATTARDALFSERDGTVEDAYARDLALRLLAGCLRRPILFDALRGLPDARSLLVEERVMRAYDVMLALAEEAPVTPRGFAQRSRQFANENDDDGLDEVTEEIARATVGTRADLEELLARRQRQRLIELGERLVKFGRSEQSRARVVQLLSETESELGSIIALSKAASSSSIAVPVPPRTRVMRDPARWSTTIPPLDTACEGGLTPASTWLIAGEGSGALALQIGLGLACLAGVPTRLMSTRRTSDGLSSLFESYRANARSAHDPPLSFHPVGDISADALLEEIVRAAMGGERLVVVEGLERVSGLNCTHAERLVRLAKEEECALILSGRKAPRLEDVFFEISCGSDAFLELTPMGADGAVFVEVTLANAAAPTSARLPTDKNGLFEGRRPR